MILVHKLRMKCMKVLVHQQPYKEILKSFGLEKLFSLRWSSSYDFFLAWFVFGLPLWKSSCLITLEIWSLILNLVLLSSKSKLTKSWFYRTHLIWNITFLIQSCTLRTSTSKSKYILFLFPFPMLLRLSVVAFNFKKFMCIN